MLIPLFYALVKAIWWFWWFWWDARVHTHLRDLRLSFSMWFSGPSLSYEARCSSAAKRIRQSEFNPSDFTRQLSDVCTRSRLDTDRPHWTPAWWPGTGGSVGLGRTDKPPDAKPGTRSPASPAPTVSVETRRWQTLLIFNHPIKTLLV